MFLASRSLRHISLIPGKWLIFCSKNNKGQLFVNIGSEEYLRSLLSYETQIFIAFFSSLSVLYIYVMWIYYRIFWEFGKIDQLFGVQIINFGAQLHFIKCAIRCPSFILFCSSLFSLKVILRCHSLTQIINIWKKLIIPATHFIYWHCQQTQ